MTKPAPAVHNHPLIEPFLDALWLERGLSDNTVSSYRTDLEKFALWLDGQGGSLLLVGSYLAVAAVVTLGALVIGGETKDVDYLA